jgi:hypothetical protein
MAGFDIYCTHCYHGHDVITATVTYADGSFQKTLRLLFLFVVVLKIAFLDQSVRVR